MTKMTAAEIIYAALVWGEEGMVQMISGCHADDPYRAEVKDQLKQLRAYRKRRFGAPADPLAGTKPMTLDEIRAAHPASNQTPAPHSRDRQGGGEG